VRLHELLGGIGVLGWVGDRGVEVSAITHDSRRAARGSCFACIPGAVTDGHLYAPAAVDAGAVALLVERELDLPVAQARVAAVRAALGEEAFAAAWAEGQAMTREQAIAYALEEEVKGSE
jgi:UDP-N-acetylmuramyl pentapeptide synthase